MLNITITPPYFINKTKYGCLQEELGGFPLHENQEQVYNKIFNKSQLILSINLAHPCSYHDGKNP